MTERLYYTDTYLDRIETTILDIGKQPNYWLKLEETIFHPQGGGQPNDQGTINGVTVDTLYKTEANEILHCFDEAQSFNIGDKVTVKINSSVRIYHAKLHTAGHLIAHLVERDYPLLKANKGSHVPGQTRVVFSGELPADREAFKAKLQQNLNTTVSENSLVTTASNEKRTVMIAGFPATSCGGTHVKTLAELKHVEVNKLKVKNGEIRLSYSVAK